MRAHHFGQHAFARGQRADVLLANAQLRLQGKIIRFDFEPFALRRLARRDVLVHLFGLSGLGRSCDFLLVGERFYLFARFGFLAVQRVEATVQRRRHRVKARKVALCVGKAVHGLHHRGLLRFDRRFPRGDLLIDLSSVHAVFFVLTALRSGHKSNTSNNS